MAIMEDKHVIARLREVSEIPVDIAADDVLLAAYKDTLTLASIRLSVACGDLLASVKCITGELVRSLSKRRR